MFGISLPEVVIIFIVIIIFVRPEDLPKFLRSAGRLYGKARRMYKEVIGVTNQVVKEINSIAALDDPSASNGPKKNAPQKLPADSPEKNPAELPAKNPADLTATDSNGSVESKEQEGEPIIRPEPFTATEAGNYNALPLKQEED